MTRSQMNAAVVEATGESLSTVRGMGFSLDRQRKPRRSPQSEALPVIDCPGCGGVVVLAWSSAEELPEFAECRRCETAFGYYDREVYDASLDDITVAEHRTYLPAA